MKLDGVIADVRYGDSTVQKLDAETTDANVQYHRYQQID